MCNRFFETDFMYLLYLFYQIFHAKLKVNEKQIKRWRSQYREQEVSYHIFPDIFPPLFFGLASLYWTRHSTTYINLKFLYSEKATKFCKIFTLLLFYVVPVKSKVKISQNFVAFSEFMNFDVTADFERGSYDIILF